MPEIRKFILLKHAKVNLFRTDVCNSKYYFCSIDYFSNKVGDYEYCDSCVVCLTHYIIAVISINALHICVLQTQS